MASDAVDPIDWPLPTPFTCTEWIGAASAGNRPRNLPHTMQPPCLYRYSIMMFSCRTISCTASALKLKMSRIFPSYLSNWGTLFSCSRLNTELNKSFTVLVMSLSFYPCMQSFESPYMLQVPYIILLFSSWKTSRRFWDCVYKFLYYLIPYCIFPALPNVLLVAQGFDVFFNYK